MNKIIRLFFSASLVVIFFFSFSSVNAIQKVNVTLFYGNTCPHCKAEKLFLIPVIEEYELVNYQELEVYDSKENSDVMLETAQELGVTHIGVPFLVIGDEYVIGYKDAQTTGQEIIKVIEEQIKLLPVEVDVEQKEVKEIEEATPESALTVLDEAKSDGLQQERFSVPFLGEINPVDVSLPFLTILIAAVDGFNPCAMWTLLFLISFLLGMNDRRRMWLLGITFIASSALVYFFFLAAWFNFFYFFAYVSWIKVGIGLLALGTGSYYLYDFSKNKEGACKVDGGGKKQKVFTKLKEFALHKNLLFALFGIMGLAFAVNLVELVCSAGLPAIYTNILSLSDVSLWKYYAYLVLYILIFMFDDMMIFIVAMVSLKAVGLDSKYARFSHLVGGILLFIIGILLLFKPELLMFS